MSRSTSVHVPVQSRRRFASHPLTFALHAIWIGSVFNTPFAMQEAYAQTAQLEVQVQETPVAQRIKSYEISAGPLSTALTQFISVSGIYLASSADLTKGKTTKGLSGNYSVEAGLNKLLEGTELSFYFTDSNTIALQQVVKTVKLKSVKVSAGTINDGYTSPIVSIGKGEQALKEIPQSVSVMTRQRIEDQNLGTIADLLGQTTGITVQQSSSVYSSFYSRGFEVTSLQLDGGASLYQGYGLGNALPDTAQFEQVEVLRGADGLFSGTGEPGGTINLKRKRPTTEFKSSIALSAGSWDSYRAEADVSGSLAFDGKLRGRTVIAWEDKDSFQDVAESDKTLFYGILETELSPTTTFALGGSYDDRNMPFVTWGLPRYSNGDDIQLPRSFYLAADWSHYDSTVETIFANLKQQLGSNWELTLDVVDTAQKNERAGVGWATAINPVTHAGGDGTPARYKYSSDQTSVDFSLKGKVELFGRTHEVIAGGNWQDVRSTAYGETSSTRYRVNDIFNFDPHAYPDPKQYTPFFYNPAYGIEQSGFYSVVRLHIADPLKIILGARYSEFEYSYIYQPLNADGSIKSRSYTHYKDDGITSPYGGIVYEFNETWSAYASMGETYKSQSDRLKGPLPGTPLDPITGRNYEIGVKGELLNGLLNTSAALYKVERNGQAISDPDYIVTPGELGSSCCFLDDGKIMSQGVDVEASGELAAGWWLSAGYTYNDNENKRGGTGRYSSVTPEHIFKLFSTFQLPGEASDWRIGGGVTAQGSSFSKGTTRDTDSNGNPIGAPIPYEFTQAGYTLWNAFAEYTISSNWAATLNINNITNETYYSTVGISSYGNFYGDPRNTTLTLRGKF